MSILSILKSNHFEINSYLLLPQAQGTAPKLGTGIFHSHWQQYLELPLYFGHHRVFDVLSLHVEKCLDVGPQRTFQCQDIH